MKRKEAVGAASAAYICHFEPEPEGGYTVTCPSLPPVVSYGDTLAQARRNAREAIELVLQVYRDEGRPMPPSDHAPRTAIDELVPVAILPP
jgi:antitoxin HicB